MVNPIVRLMSRRSRRQRIDALITELEAWESSGRDLLAQVVDLCDPGDDLQLECRRLLEHLDT